MEWGAPRAYIGYSVLSYVVFYVTNATVWTQPGHIWKRGFAVNLMVEWILNKCNNNTFAQNLLPLWTFLSVFKACFSYLIGLIYQDGITMLAESQQWSTHTQPHLSDVSEKSHLEAVDHGQHGSADQSPHWILHSLVIHPFNTLFWHIWWFLKTLIIR